MTAALGRWRATYTPGVRWCCRGRLPSSCSNPQPGMGRLDQHIVGSGRCLQLDHRSRVAVGDVQDGSTANLRCLLLDRRWHAFSGTRPDLGHRSRHRKGRGRWERNPDLGEVGLAGVEQVRVDLAHEGDITLLELPLVVGAVRASSVVLDASEGVQVSSPQGRPIAADVRGRANIEEYPSRAIHRAPARGRGISGR